MILNISLNEPVGNDGLGTLKDSNSGSALKVMQVREYIKQHFNRHLDIATLAIQVNLSHSHLFSIFKEQTGYSPIAYLARVRIDRASALLTTTTLRLKEIAMRVGYNDPQYFSRVFKLITGRSPREFRRLKSEWYLARHR
jgi:AraC-like DNA-binding protein